MKAPSAGASAWARAKLAADAFALDWLGSGVVLRSGPGPARDAWLQRLRAALPPEVPMRRIPSSISDDRLAGGLDIGATIRTGRPVAEPGVLALADGGVLVLAMAERASSRVAARLAAALDSDKVAAPAFPSEAGGRTRGAGRGMRRQRGAARHSARTLRLYCGSERRRLPGYRGGGRSKARSRSRTCAGRSRLLPIRRLWPHWSPSPPGWGSRHCARP